MKKKGGKGKLTTKQRAFAQEYIKDLNATQAAIRARYAPKSAQQKGSMLYNDPRIRVVIDELLAEQAQELAEKSGVTREMVLRELARIAFSDLRKVISWGPNGVALHNSDGLTEDEAAAVAEVSQKETSAGTHIQVKRSDKVKALELIGRHLSMFKDQEPPSGDSPPPMASINMTLAEFKAAAKQLVNEV